MNIIKPLAFSVSLFTLIPTAYASDDEGKCYEYYTAKNLKAAVPFCTKAAEQGDAKAQFNLGVLYANGQGVPQDYKQAVYWHTKAAEVALLS